MTFQKTPIRGPWKGIIGDLPSASDDVALDDCVNFFCRKGRLQTRPQWNVVNQPADHTALRVFYTFKDVAGVFHTLVVTDAGAYFLTRATPLGANIYNALTPPTGLGAWAPGSFSYREINQQVYFANGTMPLMYVDGSTNIQIAGNVPGSPLFLTENSESLIGANWNEWNVYPVSGYQNFPFRVRWSDTGNPSQWITAPGNAAGANDLINSGGQLTGLGTVGRNTYIFKRFGCTVMYPTGTLPAFRFEPFIWSNPGWGSFYPYALVNWGPMLLTLTESCELLMFDGSSFNRLASGKVRQRLQTDLLGVNPLSVLAFGSATLGSGYDLEAYWLSIPGPDVIWVHDLVEGTWQRMSSAKGIITAMQRVSVF